MPMSRGGLLM